MGANRQGRRVFRSGSIRSRLLFSALIPLVVLLPLGLRATSRDLAKSSDAGERAEAVAAFAELTTLDDAVRVEWLAALDITGSISDGIADESALVRERTGATFLTDPAVRFAEAVSGSDANLDTMTVEDEAVSSRGEALPLVRSRVDDGTIIAAEVDLFYSRFVRQIEASAATELSTAVDRAGGSALAAAQAQAAVGDLAATTGRLRQQLTLVIPRTLVGGQVDWEEVEQLAAEVDRADREITRLGFVGTTPWSDARVAASAAADRIGSLAESNPSPADLDIIDFVTELVEARASLHGAQPLIRATRLDLVDTLITSAEAERSAARQALVVSAAIVLLGITVALIVVSWAYRSIAEPLGHAAAMARQVSQGQIPDGRVETTGPNEVREVAATLDDLFSTVALIGAQASALNNGDLDNPDLARRLPGELGAELEQSIGTWRETTLRLDHELAHDPLTGIASSRRIQQATAAHAVDGSVKIAVLAIDRFKDVNDAAGRATGDELLRVLAGRLERAVPTDVLVGRLWSDEFAVVCADDGSHSTTEVADRLRATVAEPISLGSVRYRLTATVGVASGDDADRVLTNATIALREGKSMGGDVTVPFDDVLAKDLDRRSEIEAELLHALDDDVLELWFQPVIDAETDAVVGVEALVRWPLPDGTIRMPDEFVPIAEQSDLIIDLDRWVLGTACRHLAEWSDGPLADVDIAINVSARHLVDGDITGSVRDVCESWNVDPRRLSIEITESYLADNRLKVVSTLDLLHELGVTLLIDDFGTGYSSMAFIQDLPFDVLKIDRAFVSRLDEGPGAVAMVEAMVSIARALGLVVLAEGVELDRDIDRLRDLGCTQLQGFGISRPIPRVEDLEQFCVSRRRPIEVTTAGDHTPTEVTA